MADTQKLNDAFDRFEAAIEKFEGALTKRQMVAGEVDALRGDRTKIAQEHFGERLSKAYADCAAGLNAKPVAPTDVWSHWYEYATDFAQRSILFWDTLRERGNNFVEHNREGLPPLLHFDYETVVDGRTNFDV